MQAKDLIGVFPRSGKTDYRRRPPREYSFCESFAAIVRHIRPLTSIGRKLGGGVDTQALCGKSVAWDLSTPVSCNGDEPHICVPCSENFRSIPAGEVAR